MQLIRLFEHPILTSRVVHKDLLSPKLDFTNIEHWWEMRSVFNPGVALYNNLFYLLYRAQDFHFISRFGLAIFDPVSHKITERSELPVFELVSSEALKYGRIGSEDARITYFPSEGKYRITYVAATIKPITQVNVDLLKKSHPYGWYEIATRKLSTVDFTSFTDHGPIIKINSTKDIAIFPEKIGDDYVLFLRFAPSIQIAFSKDLENVHSIVELLRPRNGMWDSKKVGIGPPPILTPKGWLCIYHGVDKRDVYRLGYFLLDRFNPKKILYRSRNPILEPKLAWEKKGNTPNVVYSNGAGIHKDDVYVFYGAADKVIGAAKAPLKEFLEVI